MKLKAKLDNIVVQELNGETLIYNLLTNEALCLNETAAFVWRQCDGQKDVAEISKALAAARRQGVARELVALTIEKLKSHDLLENADQIPDSFAGLSRREVIKKVGLTTMIALPVISAIIAPAAARAASGAALLAAGAVCGGDAACQDNNCCGGICTDRQPDASPCTMDCECDSNFCKTGFGPGICQS